MEKTVRNMKTLSGNKAAEMLTEDRNLLWKCMGIKGILRKFQTPWVLFFNFLSYWIYVEDSSDF